MILVRKAELNDAPALLALIQAHAAYEKSEATISEAHLGDIIINPSPPVTIFVAEKGARLCGYAALTIDYALWRGERYAHLDCLFIESSVRGGGVGKRLLDHVRAEALSAGCRRLEWQTPHWNEGAIRFYQREGATLASKARFMLPLG